MKKIAVIAAHPDDEALGCGGSLLKCKKQGYEIHLFFMTDGIGARSDTTSQQHETRKKGIEAALKYLAPTSSTFMTYPDNQMDTVPLLEITRSVESFIHNVKPSIVLTHFLNDLNVDHRLTAQATVTACRPGSQTFVEKILSFEVPSSTEWSVGEEQFRPNYFVDVSNEVAEKAKLLECYSSEMRSYPHPRSYENVAALNQMRGAMIACKYAEAFVTLRNINHAF